MNGDFFEKMWGFLKNSGGDKNGDIWIWSGDFLPEACGHTGRKYREMISKI